MSGHRFRGGLSLIPKDKYFLQQPTAQKFVNQLFLHISGTNQLTFTDFKQNLAEFFSPLTHDYQIRGEKPELLLPNFFLSILDSSSSVNREYPLTDREHLCLATVLALRSTEYPNILQSTLSGLESDSLKDSSDFNVRAIEEICACLAEIYEQESFDPIVQSSHGELAKRYIQDRRWKVTNLYLSQEGTVDELQQQFPISGEWINFQRNVKINGEKISEALGNIAHALVVILYSNELEFVQYAEALSERGLVKEENSYLELHRSCDIEHSQKIGKTFVEALFQLIYNQRIAKKLAVKIAKTFLTYVGIELAAQTELITYFDIERARQNQPLLALKLLPDPSGNLHPSFSRKFVNFFANIQSNA